MASLPSEDSKALRYFIQRMSMVVGVEMPDGQRYHPRFLIMMLIGVFAEMLHITGLAETLPDFKKSCLSFTIYSLVIQIVARTINKNLLNDEDRIKNLQVLVLKFIQKEEQDEAFIPIMKERMQKTWSIMRIYLIISFVVYHIPIIATIKESYMSDEKALIGHLRLPYTDVNSFGGFLINSLIVLLLSFILYYQLMMSDMVFIYHSNQTVTMADIIVRKFELLGAYLRDCKRNYGIVSGMNESHAQKRKLAILARNIQDIEKELIILVKYHEDYNNYVHKTLDSYRLTAFMALSLNSIALALSLIAVRFVSLSVGSAISVILLSQVLLPCYNGNMIEDQNKKLLHALFEFPWYELTIPQRKIYLQFYVICQNTKVLKLPIIGKLDMELFTNFINASYSYVTILKNFIKV